MLRAAGAAPLAARLQRPRRCSALWDPVLLRDDVGVRRSPAGKAKTLRGVERLRAEAEATFPALHRRTAVGEGDAARHGGRLAELVRTTTRCIEAAVSYVSLAQRPALTHVCLGCFRIADGEKRNPYIPTKPNVVYADQGWAGWDDFLNGPVEPAAVVFQKGYRRGRWLRGPLSEIKALRSEDDSLEADG